MYNGDEENNNTGPTPLDDVWNKESQIMIGIDIGSTQSGVAVAFLQKGVKQTIHRVTQWPGQALEHQSKIPTLVWYDKHGKAMLFGAEAITQQARDNAEDNGWTLAKRFKLHLHPSEMRAKHSIKVEALPNGLTLSRIYADFMKYLLKHTVPFFKDRIVDGPTIWEAYKDTATFVIGHPNGYSLREQDFLRKAAIDGGLVGAADAKSRVRFVTEAEASVHFCIAHSNISSRLRIGSNFAVCDAGGSTIDSTIYTVTATNPLLKLAEKRDSACVQAGGLYIDDAVERYLEDVLTRSGMNAEDIKEYVQEGVDDFERIPKRLFADGSEDLKLKLGERSFTDPDINVRRGVMTIQNPTPKRFFDYCVRAVIKSLDDQINGENISHILLVGGLGDSMYLRDQLRAYFHPAIQLVTVNDSTSKAVAEGAVMWNTMTSVFTRAPNWSYGIQGYVRFDSYSSDHRERTTFTTPDGYEKITGVWCEIVKKGVPLNVNAVCRQSFFRTYSTPHPNLESIEIALYSYSGNDQPKWLRSKGGSLLKGFDNVCLITADLRSLAGALEAKIGPRGTYWGLLFWVCVRFGGTEISAYLEWEEDGETRFGPISIIPQGVRWA
ncbi:heat shock 70 kDa protein 12A [Rhizoctonia solani 123E]|uniref:Heat shock 70 kDa protein 12A n=1 Tax=Rhizoctonia solani 123E TaxID=1423351 RepID=A0A074S410_9AGAM|nr:heat shock 70 kDa protein 12A [Rhizoctonia solani 123E]